MLAATAYWILCTDDVQHFGDRAWERVSVGIDEDQLEVIILILIECRFYAIERFPYDFFFIEGGDYSG
ncbi:MAG: hypothetical protein GY943_01575 [Chloroflexi bacterium]|nr:hypothetical protein [Chloroflexota bacterium]